MEKASADLKEENGVIRSNTISSDGRHKNDGKDTIVVALIVQVGVKNIGMM